MCYHQWFARFHWTMTDNCISSMLPNECSPPKASTIWQGLLEGYLAVIIAVFGVVGNSMSIAVLLDGLFVELFDRLMVCLAICDIIFLGKTFIYIWIDILEFIFMLKRKNEKQYLSFLVTSLPISLQKAYLSNDISAIDRSGTLLDIGRIFSPVARIFLNGSSYVTVSMAIERLIGKRIKFLRINIYQCFKICR